MHQNKADKTSLSASTFAQTCAVYTTNKLLFILPLLLVGGISVSFGQVLSVNAGNWDDPTVWSGGIVPRPIHGLV
jgi:hypothetical protein